MDNKELLKKLRENIKNIARDEGIPTAPFIGGELRDHISFSDSGLGIQFPATQGSGFILLTAPASANGYTITWPVAVPASGSVLQTDASGQGYWSAFTPASIGSPSGSGSSTGTNTGDQTITLSGAITGSGSGTIVTTLVASAVATSHIQDSAVTNAKLANMANGTIKGRNTAGTGAPEDLTTLPTAAFPALTGDIHNVAGSLSTTLQPSTVNTTNIVASAVTYAKMQTVSASGFILGRKTAGAGIVEEVAISNQGFNVIASTTPASARANIGAQGNILQQTTYTSGSGTFTTGANTISLIVEIIGAGGGSGGSAQGIGTCGAGGSGGGGAYCKKWITSPASGYSYSVGTGGASGAAGNNAGSAGGQTTFGSLTASGGLGGAGMAAGSSALFALGGAGGTATGGDFNLVGGPGGHGIRLSGTIGASQQGGSTMFGDGPIGLTATASGKAGVNPGTGASGSFSTASDKAGANGANGIVVVTELG